MSFELLKKWKIHNKYVVKVKWSYDGKLFVSASRDGTFTLFKFDLDTFDSEQLLHVTIGSCIESFDFTKDNKHIVTTSRDDNYLHYINIETSQEQLCNMNAFGDDYISFNVLDINCSPDGSSVLVSTDKSRAILFQTCSPFQKRNFYGFLSDEWSLPRAVFSNNNQYIYTTSQDNKVYVYAVANEKIVYQIAGHTGVVRDIAMHPTKDILSTCSYDKTVKLWQV